MPTFYNDVDGKLEAVLENLLTTQAATTGSNIANVPLHTGLSTADVTEDLIFALVESAEESPSGTGNWLCSTTVAIYSQAETNTLATHRGRVAEVRDLFMNTNLAAAGGCIGALIVAKVLFGKADLTMALNGCLAGLVAITAGPDTPSALQATIFGALGGLLVVFSITTLDKLKIDDPVGAISVHGVVGLLGLLLVPVTNDGASFSGQIIGALTIFGWVFATSLVAFFVIKMVMGLRVSEEEEYEGVDVSECGMEAYPEFAK